MKDRRWVRRLCMGWAFALAGAGASAQAAAGTAPAGRLDVAYSVTLPSSRNELWAMRSDGSGKVLLASLEGRPAGPSWSPDGRYLAFYNHRSERRWTLHLLDITKGGVESLAPAGDWLDASPTWSPDGGRIFFARNYPGPPWRSELWSVLPDGSGLGRLGSMDGQGPDCSPDGRTLAYFNYVEGGGDVWVVDVVDLRPRRLTDHPAEDWWPNWSPDGKRIAFQSMRDGNFEIYVMNADGSGAKRLTSNPAEDAEPKWSPDGRSILFSSMRDGHYEIYVMMADGSGPRRLTESAGHAINPDWNPAGDGNRSRQ